MRTNIISHSIKLDTTTLVNLLFTGRKSNYLFNGNLKSKQSEIWGLFFNTNLKCFTKSNYSFHHMIQTDGVSCSILFLRNDLVGKKLPKALKDSKEKYIDELTDNEYNNLKTKKIVAYDPNKGDLIYCVNDDSKNAKELRYTQDSRRKECKLKKYAKMIIKFKKELIDNMSIMDYETKMSKYNKKTLDFDKFKEYIKHKSELNFKLNEFYNRYIFRKLKLNKYINIKKHEQGLMNRFKKMYGKAEEVIVCAGDFEQKKHMKYKEPVKGKGMRKLFKENGYKVFLVDEHRTSCMCAKCEKEEGRCEKFIKRENPRPYREGKELIHGVLRCKNCNAVWNRDVNAATNIFRIVKNTILQQARPLYLSRKKKVSGRMTLPTPII